MCVAPKSGPGREYSIAVDWRDCAWSPPIVVQFPAAAQPDPVAQTSPPSPPASARSRRSEAETDKSVYPEGVRGWSRVSKPANRVIPNALPAWPPSRRSGALARREGGKPAIQQVWKPAPRAGASGRNRIYF